MRPLPPRPNQKKSPGPKVSNKKFGTAKWEGTKKGERIILYTDSGMGKTTLASMLPNPKFADFKGGSDKIKHPVTGESLVYIPGVETFGDVQAICRQDDLFDPGDSLVIDTMTDFEYVAALTWTFENVPHEKGHKVKRIEGYGYGKGYRHLYDTMRLPLMSFDYLIDRGVNVVLSCQMQQVEISNSGGGDFLCDVPKLQKAHGKSTPAVWELYDEWADHILKIDYNDVQAADGKAFGTNERVVRVHGQPHFKAKSRTIPHTFPVVSFDSPQDDSIWQFIFEEAWKELTQ